MRNGLIPVSLKAVALIATVCLAAPAGLAADDQPPADLILVFDASGSMWGQIEGENKIVIARRVIGQLIDGLPDAQRVGLVAYGHRREGDCSDIELVTPLGPLDRGALKATVDDLNPKGKTPITASLEQAFKVVEGSGHGASVILISDGLETCGADPCQRVKLAKEQGLEFVLHVVGFDVAGEDVSSLECAAQAGAGQFHSAESADQLASALEGAVAQPVDVPAGGLSVRVIANGELYDASVHAAPRDSKVEPRSGRTYASPDTNPRFLPLPGGVYDVSVKAVGLRGDVERRFEVTIPEGEIVEREFDFSSGNLSVGVTRNGELSDATVRIYVAGTSQEIDSGRTYVNPSSNPDRFELTSGTYDVLIKSVEISGDAQHRFEGLEVGPDAEAEVAHDFSSGSLSVGSRRGGELVDSTLNIVSVAEGKSVGAGRTYRSANSNPKTFVLAPGEYEVSVREVGGDRAQETFTVTIEKGATVERLAEYP